MIVTVEAIAAADDFQPVVDRLDGNGGDDTVDTRRRAAADK